MGARAAALRRGAALHPAIIRGFARFPRPAAVNLRHIRRSAPGRPPDASPAGTRHLSRRSAGGHPVRRRVLARLVARRRAGAAPAVRRRSRKTRGMHLLDCSPRIEPMRIAARKTAPNLMRRLGEAAAETLWTTRCAVCDAPGDAFLCSDNSLGRTNCPEIPQP